MATTGPRRIGRYRIERRLGAGGMGAVYLARSPAGLRVAVKVVHPEIAADPDFRRRFRREIEAVRLIGPLYTAPLIDADPDAATPWFAAVYLDGDSLHDRVERDGPLTVPDVRTLAAGLAEALVAVHAAATGHSPVGDGTLHEVVGRIIQGRLDLGRLPAALRPVVVPCLHTEPGRRPTATALAEQLTGPGPRPAAVAGPVAPAAPSPPPVTTDRPTAVIRRRPRVARVRWVPVALALVLATAGIATWYDRSLDTASHSAAGPPAAPANYPGRTPELVLKGSARALAFSPDGRTIAAGGDGGTVTLWDRATGDRRATLDGVPFGVLALAYSPDGRYVAARGTGDYVGVWSVATGRLVHRFDGGNGPVGEIGSVAFAPDGRSVAAAEYTGTFVHDLPTGHTVDYPVAGDWYQVSVASEFDPRGRLLITADQTAVTAWRLSDSGSPQWRKDLTDSTALAVGADGAGFALGDDRGTVTVRSMLTGDPSVTIDPRRGSIRSLAYDSAHGRLVTGLDNGVAVWSATTGRLVESLSGDPGPVLSVAFSPDGAYVAACGPTGDIRLWPVS